MFHRYYTEVKHRILLFLISGILIFLVSYVFKEVLLSIVINSYAVSSTLELSYFIFTDVVEVFNVYVCLIFFVSKQVLTFYLFYHLLIFISPGLTRFEYSYLVLLCLVSSFLFFLSTVLFKKFLFPFSWNFFLSFKHFVVLKSLTLHFEAKLLDYVMFFMKLYFSCIIYFQFFLFPIFLFTYFGGELNVYQFFRKFLYYVCIIFSTIVTPPDVTSQIVLSFSLIIGCEILVYVSLFKSVLKKELVW